MAKRTGQTKPLHELRQEIAHSRDRLARDLSGLRYELDFPLKFRKSVQRNTGVWVSAAAVAGVVLSFLPARTKKVKVESSGGGGEQKRKGEEQKKGLLGSALLLGLLRIAATMAKPAVTSYVTSRLTGTRSGRRRV